MTGRLLRCCFVRRLACWKGSGQNATLHIWTSLSSSRSFFFFFFFPSYLDLPHRRQGICVCVFIFFYVLYFVYSLLFSSLSSSRSFYFFYFFPFIFSIFFLHTSTSPYRRQGTLVFVIYYFHFNVFYHVYSPHIFLLFA